LTKPDYSYAIKSLSVKSKLEQPKMTDWIPLFNGIQPVIFAACMNKFVIRVVVSIRLVFNKNMIMKQRKYNKSVKGHAHGMIDLK